MKLKNQLLHGQYPGDIIDYSFENMFFLSNFQVVNNSYAPFIKAC